MCTSKLVFKSHSRPDLSDSGGGNVPVQVRKVWLDESMLQAQGSP